MKTFNEFQESVASMALKGGSKFILPKIPSALKAIGAGAATGAAILQSKKGKFGKDAPETRKGLKNIAKNVDKNKLEPDTASDREELIAKSRPDVKNIVDKEIKKDQGMDRLLDRIKNGSKVKGPFADTGGFDASKSRTKRQYYGLPPSSKLSKQQKKDRKITGQREILRKRDDKLSKEGPGDQVPNAKRERLQKLLKRYGKLKE